MGSATVDNLSSAADRVRKSAQAVGTALASVQVYAEPAIARAVQAEQNLYERIRAEFGLLTSAEAGTRMGSRSSAPRNLAAAAHRDAAVVAVRRGSQLAYPGFQFGPDGQPLPVMRRLRQIADTNGWSETGLVQWLCAPTTYLDGDRPVDHLTHDPDRVADTAAHALGISW